MFRHACRSVSLSLPFRIVLLSATLSLSAELQAQTWQMTRHTNQMTDSTAEAVWVMSTASAPARSSARLVVTCDADRVIVVYQLRRMLTGDREGRIDMQMRIDSSAPVAARWIVDRDVEGLLRPANADVPQVLRAIMFGRTRLVLGYSEPIAPEAVNGWNAFPLRGSTAALRSLKCFPRIAELVGQ